MAVGVLAVGVPAVGTGCGAVVFRWDMSKGGEQGWMEIRFCFNKNWTSKFQNR